MGCVAIDQKKSRWRLFFCTRMFDEMMHKFQKIFACDPSSAISILTNEKIRNIYKESNYSGKNTKKPEVLTKGGISKKYILLGTSHVCLFHVCFMFVVKRETKKTQKINTNAKEYVICP